jgi:ABC-2 type transport system ATP-binding protein
VKSLQITNLGKSFGQKQALQGISLTIPQGILGLLGPNGAGKTTLMRILTTLLPPSTGEIKMGEINWRDVQKVREIIGYLPQKFSLYKQIRVHEALTHIATLKGLKYDVKKQVDQVLEKVNLTEQRKLKIGQLSGGMIRRVGIAQAMLGSPKIIVIDEPTAGLDPEERIRFRKYMRQLSRDTTVIISTHIVEDIEATCEQVAILFQGRVMILGGTDQITSAATGKVWEITVEKDQFYQLSDQLQVISSQKVDHRYRLKFISDHPPLPAHACEPTLEDGYLYMIKKEIS